MALLIKLQSHPLNQSDHLRLTPGIECHTTNTSARGIWIANLALIPRRWTRCLALSVNNLKLCCVHAHIGSQIFERQPHQDLAGVMVEWLDKATRYGLPVTELNVVVV